MTLRLVLGATLLQSDAFFPCHGLSVQMSHEVHTIVPFVAAALLATGILTPLVGAVIATAEVGSLLWCLATAAGMKGLYTSALPIAGVAFALSLIGPGAYSVDAHLFGWQRIEIPPSHDLS